jgi:hypothetical protein
METRCPSARGITSQPSRTEESRVRAPAPSAPSGVTPGRRLMGTHQETVSHKHVDYCLDEFTFRFNRRTSRSRGQLFYHLVQQAGALGPASHDEVVHRGAQEPKPQYVNRIPRLLNLA